MEKTSRVDFFMPGYYHLWDRSTRLGAHFLCMVRPLRFAVIVKVLNRRLSSAIVKWVDALSSYRNSRSMAFILSATSPASPRSTSTFFTHSTSVRPVQPILGTTEQIGPTVISPPHRAAAPSALSQRSSAENLFAVFRPIDPLSRSEIRRLLDLITVHSSSRVAGNIRGAPLWGKWLGGTLSGSLVALAKS